jgi:hypothetical protein
MLLSLRPERFYSKGAGEGATEAIIFIAWLSNFSVAEIRTESRR